MRDPWTGIEASAVGLYLHFPFCLAKCPYCDFAVTVASVIPEERYADAIQRELELRLAARPDLKERVFESIFLGGGTPSLWAPRHVERVLSAVGRLLRLGSQVEISLEANPEAVSEERLRGYRSAGVNRLSLGAQSFSPQVLRSLGRAHDAARIRSAVVEARRAGFDNLSLDLIQGVQGQSVAEALEDAAQAVALAPEHLSAYALTLERDVLAEETPLARQHARGEVVLPSDDDQVLMAEGLEDVLRTAGLGRYEISNHARPGFASRHNALYWTGGEYLALGVGATGLIYPTPRLRPDSAPAQARRFTNLRSTPKYLEAVEAGRLPEASEEVLGARELFEERLAMGLRLRAGVDVRAVCEAFGEDFGPRQGTLTRLCADGFVDFVDFQDDRRAALTRRGAHLHSAISARLI